MDKNIFTNRLAQLGICRQVNSAMVVAQSQKVIHDEFGTRGDENLKVVSYKAGVLKIASTSSAWSAECRGIITKLQVSPVARVQFIFMSQIEKEN